MPKFGVGEGLAALFSGFIQAAGRQRLQSYLADQDKRRGIEEREIDLAIEKINDPNTPALEKMQHNQNYKRITGHNLPMDMEALSPVPGQREQTAEPADLNYFLRTGSTPDIENYMKKSAERQKILQDVETSKSLEKERTAKADLTRKQIGQVGKTKPTTPAKTKEPKDERLALLKTDYNMTMERRQKETIDAFDKVIDPKKHKEYTDHLNEIKTQIAELLKEQDSNIKIPVIGWGSTKK